MSDLVGVGLGVAATVISGYHCSTDLVVARTVHRLRRDGRRMNAEVVGVDRYRRFDVRATLKRPVVRYLVDGRPHETALDNFQGSLPEGSGVDVLVDRRYPLSVVAADRHDARNSAILLAAATALALVLTVLSALVW